MEFKRDEPVKVRFVVPDTMTVRQQMRYYSEASGVLVSTHFERLWLGARSIITEWECSLFQKDVDIDTVSNTDITETMIWVSAKVREHINKLDEIPKN